MQKRLRQVTTVNSTLLINKHVQYVCVMRLEIHAQKWDMYMYNIITHICSVQYTALDFIPVVVQEHVVIITES